MAVFYEQTYEKITSIERGTYEECIFKNCDFSEAYLNGYTFENCTFIDCNLANANVQNSMFQKVSFDRCKLLGIHFNKANLFLFEVFFEECQLNFSSFNNCNLKNTTFNSCQLASVDFSNSDLSGVYLNNCDLKNAVFDTTNLEKADFTTAYNFDISPEHNKLKQAKFSLEGLPGLLSYYKIIVK